MCCSLPELTEEFDHVILLAKLLLDFGLFHLCEIRFECRESSLRLYAQAGFQRVLSEQRRQLKLRCLIPIHGKKFDIPWRAIE